MTSPTAPATQYYPPASESPRPTVPGAGASASEKSLRDRQTHPWPAVWRSTDDEVGAQVLRTIHAEHDGAHLNCRTESWHVNARVGKKRAYTVFATFYSNAIISHVHSATSADAPLTFVSGVRWGVIDNEKKRYWSFSDIDHQAPVVLSAQILGGGYLDDPHVTQALVEQLNNDAPILPDRLMPASSAVRLSDLDLRYGACTLKALPHDGDQPMYQLHLEGLTNRTGGEEMDAEVRVEVDLTIRADVVPVLLGDRGVVSNGHWEDDQFAYAMPHCRVRRGAIRVTRASDELEFVRDLDLRTGSAWYEHAFGGAVAQSAEEAEVLRTRRATRREGNDLVPLWNRCSIRFLNERQDALVVSSTLRPSPPAEKDSKKEGAHSGDVVWAISQCGSSRQAYVAPHGSVVFTPVPAKQYRSGETGMLYPTQFRLKTVLQGEGGGDVDLTLDAAFPEQEFITMSEQPSCWSGAVVVSGTLTRADGSQEEMFGEGYLVMRGHRRNQSVTQMYNMLSHVTRPALEAAEVGRVPHDRVVEEKVVPLMRTVGVLSAMLGSPLSSSHTMILTSLFATYARIFHHHGSATEVKQAIEACHGVWSRYYPGRPIPVRALLLRGFMLRELGGVVRARCPQFFHEDAADLDIVTPAVRAESDEPLLKKRRGEPLEVPLAADVAAPLPDLHFATLDALMSGEWMHVPGEYRGSLNKLLLHEGVSILWRNLLTKVSPNLKIDVDCDARIVHITATAAIHTEAIAIPVGQPFKRLVPGISDTKACEARAQLLAEGRVLFIETAMGDGVERVWYRFERSGKTMVCQRYFFPSAAAGDAPAAGYEATFVLREK